MAAELPLSKRRRIDASNVGIDEPSEEDENRARSPLMSLDRDITPPLSSYAASSTHLAAPRHFESSGARQNAHDNKETYDSDTTDDDTTEDEDRTDDQLDFIRTPSATSTPTKVIRSPIQLTRIRDLPDSSNIDTVSLHDILGDPLIKECWQFNYLHDVDFIMSALHPHVRSLIPVKIIHGFWKREEPSRQRLEETAKRYPNVQLLTAHMPEAFGTHHSKMMIILRDDDCAQVVIHTANMIERDWGNLCQGVWRSPLLPLIGNPEEDLPPDLIGTGIRFKCDLLRYLKAYGGRTRTLVDQLKLYDFSSVRAALLSSTPSRTSLINSRPEKQTAFGWPGLKQILSTIPSPKNDNEAPNIIAQVSSIATLSEKWVSNFLGSLHTSKPLATPATFTLGKNTKPKYNIIFPTAENIRSSLDGYASGASIHTKIQSSAQAKQLGLLRPMLCHWDGSQNPRQSDQVPVREAQRRRAAPHIKTYICFTSQEQTEIQWAMLTSANLSQQAWGAMPDKEGVVRISSYEIGVVVWPELFREGKQREGQVRMVPVFGRDLPDAREVGKGVVVGFRMPYDLPLVPYRRDEMPWCATAEYTEPDWKGAAWMDGDG